MTWGRKTGGRKKGTPNKIKKPPALMAEAQAEVAAAVSANEGLQPLDYMLQVMTWGRKTGGRKRGTPNKIKKPPALMAEAQAEVAAAVSANEGLQPLDYMLQVMRDPTASEARRDMMAKAAAPYRHGQVARAGVGRVVKSRATNPH
jgi:hypothetical protein